MQHGHHLTAGYSSYGSGQTQNFLLEADTGSPQDNFTYARITQERCDLAETNWEHEAVQRLLAQAQTLEVAFNRFLSMSALLMAKDSQASERYAQLALKAQSECRKTMLAIDQIKHPRKAVFVRHQQNLVLQSDAQTHTNPQKEVSSHAALEQGSQREAITINPELETVDVCNGPDNSNGKGYK